MGNAAITVAKAVNYRGAGTVEFIVDGDAPNDDMPFYFMEMNTRLQVEHPVTEMITGQDLVAWQFAVANGQPLPATQEELHFNGHAIETRLYAENPTKKFLPQPGMLDVLQFPPETDTLRVEAGVQQGDEVTIFYDPMLAKLSAWGADRVAATQAMADALAATKLEGIQTNLGFLERIMRHPAFEGGQLDTGFVDRHMDDLLG
jgi:3-methylcrotonyl-CoA carboxylase alpha subunit